MKINGFAPDTSVFEKVGQASGSTETSGSNFGDMLQSKLDEVNNAQLNADSVTESFIKGEGPDVHEVMLAGEEAKMSMQLAVQIRNKFVEAYQEINRTQV